MKAASSSKRSAGSLSSTSHSSVRSRLPSHQYMEATGPATCAHAASRDSTTARESSIASARESVVVCTWRYSASRSAMTMMLRLPGPSTLAPFSLGWEERGLELVHSGKVRELYADGDDLIMVASDRVSVYDVVLPTPVPGKGRVLTQLSLWWFGQLAGVVPNHVISGTDVPAEWAGRAIRCRRLTMLPVE